MNNENNILITGGTGTFGTAFLKKSLRESLYSKITIFSRDEFKQHDLRLDLLKDFDDSTINDRVRFFIGDVRDKDRLVSATKNQNIVIHAAALKHVNLCEYNPQEAIKTNILGTQNLVDACIQNEVEKVVCLSTDKSVNPINLYGATKLCLEKIALNSNYLAGRGKTKISVVRYGNVIASRGSVIPTLFKCRSDGSVFNLTDANMTRFWLTISDAIELVLFAINHSSGMEIFVPKMKSLTMDQLIKFIGNINVKNVGLRPGEKMHEMMISPHETNRTFVVSDKIYMIVPELYPGITPNYKCYFPKVDFEQYTSDIVDRLTKEEFFEMIK